MESVIVLMVFIKQSLWYLIIFLWSPCTLTFSSGEALFFNALTCFVWHVRLVASSETVTSNRDHVHPFYLIQMPVPMP